MNNLPNSPIDNTSPNETESNELLKKFIDHFLQIFRETKYNLVSLNKRYDYLDSCFNNILLLNNPTIAMQERDQKEEEEEKQKHSDNLLEINEEDLEMIAKNIMEQDQANMNEDYIPTNVKPENKVANYSEFLKMKNNTQQASNILNQKDKAKRDKEDLKQNKKKKFDVDVLPVNGNVLGNKRGRTINKIPNK